ncbi:hypothetical protein ACIQ7S_13180 [Streptomyces griseoluteus]|uniref:hypothetical protein n=1 Tax=Streptomyces griseoluteus TaxID=29306 RepID=UPI003325B06B
MSRPSRSRETGGSPWNAVRQACLTAGAVFGTLWTLLEPLGGFTVLDRNYSRSTADYLALVLASLTIGSVPVLLRSGEFERGPVTALSGNRSRFDTPGFVASSTNRVCVLGLTLPTFASEQMIEVFRNRIAAGVSVRLILVNPFSPTLLQRPSRLYSAQMAPQVTGASTIISLLRFRASLPPGQLMNFSFRVTNLLPSVGLVVRDQDCIWHPYLARYTGVRSPYIENRTDDSDVGAEMIRYFDDLWAMSHELETSSPAAELENIYVSDALCTPDTSENEVHLIRRILGDRT